jgi:predicted DNA-binding protein (MmcQ/YjbR family)
MGRKKLKIDMEVFGYLFELYLSDAIQLDEILNKLDITKTTFYKLQQIYLVIRQIQDRKQIAFKVKTEEGEVLIHVKELYKLANEVVDGEYLQRIKKEGGGVNE